MTSPKFWTEASIAGFLYLLSIFFLTLKFLGIENICMEDWWSEYLPYLAVAVVAISYLLGLTAHVLIPILLRRPARFLKIITQRIEQDRSRNDARLLQFGTESLQKQVKSQYSTWILFRLLTVGFPLAGLSCAIWMSGTPRSPFAWSIAIVSFIFGGLFLWAYKRLESEFRGIQSSVDELTRRLERHYARRGR